MSRIASTGDYLALLLLPRISPFVFVFPFCKLIMHLKVWNCFVLEDFSILTLFRETLNPYVKIKFENYL